MSSTEYQQSWHQANKDRRNPEIHERSRAAVAATRDAVQQHLRATGGCCDCGRTDTSLGVQLVASEADPRGFSALVTNGRSIARLLPLITAARARGDIRCAGCVSVRFHAGRAPLPGVDSGVTKFCAGCATVQPIERFSFKNKAKGTRQGRCKPCHSAQVKACQAR